MPWKYVKEGGKFCVVNKTTGEKLSGGCFDEEGDAAQQVATLVAGEIKAAKYCIVPEGGLYAVREMLSRALKTRWDTYAEAQLEVESLAGSLKAHWTTAQKNDLPDTAFLYIEAGGRRDSNGKTAPRSLRHFPVRNIKGGLDEAHVRSALARIPQSALSDKIKASATKKARLLAKEIGIEVSE